MRWKKFEWPINGDTTLMKRFAFWPTLLSDGYIVWFEKYNSLEKFQIQGKDWDTAHWKQIKTWRLGCDEPNIVQ